MAEKVARARRILVGCRLVEALGDFLKGVSGYAKQQGRNWQVQCVDADEFRSEFTAASVDGAIAVVRQDQRELVASHRRGTVPVVNFLHNLSPGVASVLSDDQAHGRVGAEYFIGCGFQQFAFLSFNGRWCREREKGFVEALARVGKDCHLSPSFLRTGDHHRLYTPKAAAAMRQWIKDLPKPIAMMVCSDRIARLILAVCLDTGVRVPEQIAILGVDNLIPTCELSPIPLSSVAQDFPQLGFEAARLLDRLMAGGKPPATAVLVPPGKVVVRHSTNVLVFEDEYISTAMQLIRQKAAVGIPMKELMRQVPVSRKWLDLRFKELIGHTPSSEIRKVRLEHVRDLLLNTDLSVRQIATRCGFPRPENLIRFFRDGYGVPPQTYRTSNHPQTVRRDG